MKINPINRVTDNRWPEPFVPLFLTVPTSFEPKHPSAEILTLMQPYAYIRVARLL
jgi:hypothetical protein